MVNINHIKRLLKQDRGTIVMSDEFEIPVSQERKGDLQVFMDRFKL
jgi:DNA-binding LytR/AlgR family response regulator